MIRFFQKVFLSGESGRVFKGMLTLIVGSGLARLLGVISIPLLTRIYSPEDYGILALYSSFVAILVPVFTLRYVQAIPLPNNIFLALNLFLLCLFFIIVAAILTTIILFFFGDHIFSIFNIEELQTWWWLIVLGASGGATYELFTLWAVREKSYGLISKVQIKQSFIGESLKIILGMFNLKPVGLLVGQVVAQSYGVIDYYKGNAKNLKLLRRSFSLKRIIILFRYFFDFALFRLPSDLLLVVSVQAPLLITATAFGRETTGQLSLAIMALSLPVSLIGAAMARAYYAEIASIGKTQASKIKNITISIQKKLFAIAIPMTLVIFFFSEKLFEIFFGEDWLEAGKFASILAPYVLLQFTSSPLMQVVNVIGRQSLYFYMNSGRVIGLVFLYFYITQNNVSVDSFIFLLSFYLSFYYLVQSLTIIYLINKVKK